MSWYSNIWDKELTKMMTILERLNQVDDVRKFIPKFVLYDSVSMYKLFKLISPPREASPVRDIIQSFSEFKKGAAALFGLNGNDSSKEDTKEDSVDENKDEYGDEQSSPTNLMKLRITSPSINLLKGKILDPTPVCEPLSYVRISY